MVRHGLSEFPVIYAMDNRDWPRLVCISKYSTGRDDFRLYSFVPSKILACYSIAQLDKLVSKQANFCFQMDASGVLIKIYCMGWSMPIFILGLVTTMITFFCHTVLPPCLQFCPLTELVYCTNRGQPVHSCDRKVNEKDGVVATYKSLKLKMCKWHLLLRLHKESSIIV